jgi:hypothetical protein
MLPEASKLGARDIWFSMLTDAIYQHRPVHSPLCTNSLIRTLFNSLDAENATGILRTDWTLPIRVEDTASKKEIILPMSGRTTASPEAQRWLLTYTTTKATTPL